MINFDKEIKNDYYDFICNGSRYYRVFYNGMIIDKDFMCGHVFADIGTRFVPCDFTYTNGEKSKILVPDKEDYLKDVEDGSNKNPKYGTCLVDSEFFYTYFAPGDCIDGIDDARWHSRYNNLRRIMNLIESKHKSYILDKLESIEFGRRFIMRALETEDDYERFINRHNLWFAEDYEIIHVKDIVEKAYKEAN